MWNEGDGMRKEQTNADRIRAMSDEELAEVLAFGLGCLLKAPHCMDTDCRPCYLKWLKQPAEEGDGNEKRRDET